MPRLVTFLTRPLQIWSHLIVTALKALAMSAVAGVLGLLFWLGLSIAEAFN